MRIIEYGSQRELFLTEIVSLIMLNPPRIRLEQSHEGTQRNEFQLTSLPAAKHRAKNVD